MPEANDNPTIISDSTVGQRLLRVRPAGAMVIVFQGRQVPVTSRITVGRDADNAISLEDTLASRHHAVIQKIGEQFFVRDLGSTNGTFVNGWAVPPGRYQRVHPFDVVRIGRTELSLRRLGHTE